MISTGSATRDYINLIRIHIFVRLVHLLGNSFLKTKSESEILKKHGLKNINFYCNFPYSFIAQRLNAE